MTVIVFLDLGHPGYMPDIGGDVVAAVKLSKVEKTIDLNYTTMSKYYFTLRSACFSIY